MAAMDGSVVGWWAFQLCFSPFQGGGASEGGSLAGGEALRWRARGSNCGDLNGRNKGMVLMIVVSSLFPPSVDPDPAPRIHWLTGVEVYLQRRSVDGDIENGLVDRAGEGGEDRTT